MTLFKNKLFLLLTLTSLLFCPQGAKAKLVSLDTYNVNLSENWKQIPEDIFATSMKKIKQSFNKKTPTYQSGFQLIDRDLFKYPYILTKEQTYNNPVAFNEVVKGLAGSMNNRIDLSFEDKPDMITDAQFGDMLVDTEKQIISFSGSSQIKGVGQIMVQTAIIVKDRTVVTLYLYTLPNEQKPFVNNFYEMVNSVKIQLNKPNQNSSSTNAPLIPIFLGMLIAAIFGIGTYFFQKTSKNSS
jgi:hypothetical protein